MKILSVASECAPFVKTGGLADVAGALPPALSAEGVKMTTLLPGYPAVMAALDKGKEVRATGDLFGAPARVLAGKAAGLDLLVLDAPHFYARSGSIYLGPDGRDWPDNPERYAALCWAAMEIARDGADGWKPDLVHAHDWQGGLAPYFLKKHLPGVPSVLTIHNIAFQGLAPADRMASLRLDPGDFHAGAFEYYGKISALKAGLIYASRLTTVSPTYARELLTPEFGMGLDGVLRQRQADLSGILNGIDLDVWNPATDPAVTVYTAPSGKAPNRAALRDEFGLGEADGPLCVVISRLTEQKGLDLLLEAVPALTGRGGQLALLGTGNRSLEDAWRAAADRLPGLSVRIGYDEELSHRMMAGGDAIIIPSRFEPCGLTQLYGLRYGTIPLVALTGGLADTIIPASDAGIRAGVATGLQIHPLSADSLRDGLARLCALYSDRSVWTRMQENAMRHPVGWEVSAADYAALYGALTEA
ncbi:MAG: glycogen synthase GlgA [Rhodobacteraceae bacterium]|nr:glycogen synthase GlgA [Paracoccaceae bacterium]